MPGSGKTGAAKYLSKKLKVKYYSAGMFMRMIAERHNMSLLHLSKVAEADPTIDHRIDSVHKKLEGEDNFVLDSRLGFYFFHDAIKVYLSVRPETAAKRLMKRERKLEASIDSMRKTLAAINERERSAYKRFKDIYGIDIYDKKNYEIVIDTSKMTPVQVNIAVLKEVKRFIPPRKGF